MDYSSELAKLSDEQLAAMAQEPETSFAPALWSALQSELTLRRAPRPMAEAARRATRPLATIQDVESWMVVANLMRSGTSPEAVYRLIEQVIATDPMLSPFGQAEYPLDLQVSFDAGAITSDGSPSIAELMWVRTVGVGTKPNRWIGRLLNTPGCFSLAAKDDYVEFRCDNRGLFFERVLERADSPNRGGSRNPLPGDD